MHSPLEAPRPSASPALLGGSIATSVVLHLLFAWWMIGVKVPDKFESTWMEMVVNEPPPPEPPPPEPEPESVPESPDAEAPAPEPEPEAVEFEETVVPPPVDEPPPRRVVHGLSASSFAAGGEGGMARAGNSLRTRPTEELLGLEDAVPLPAVTFQPRLRGAPPQVVVPQEAIDAEIEGSWTIRLDISAEGVVVRARMKSPAGYGIDEACVAAWSQTRWRPARKNGNPVAVLNVPKKCTLTAID